MGFVLRLALALERFNLRLAALSNEKLDPWVNWTTLGPPLMKSLGAKPRAEFIAPPPFQFGNVAEWCRTALRLRKSDTLFWMQGSARPETPIWAASILRGLVRRSAFVVDPWPSAYGKIGFLARIQRLNPCFIPYRQSQIELSKFFPEARFEWLPFGIDANVFRPRDVEKDVFIYWMGRRYEPLHRAILAYCDARGLTYIYTRKGGEVSDPQDLGRLVSRAQYFVVTPPNLDNPIRTQGISPLVMRYMEGLAAGTRLLGVLPGSGEYEDLLPLDAILQVKLDGSDLAKQLEKDAGNQEAVWAVERASDLVRTQHSWEMRAEQIYLRLNDEPMDFSHRRARTHKLGEEILH